MNIMRVNYNLHNYCSSCETINPKWQYVCDKCHLKLRTRTMKKKVKIDKDRFYNLVRVS